MADRVVKVSLQAQVSNYVANMEQARKGTKKVTETLEEQKAASIAAAKAQGEAAAEVGRGMVAVGALAAVAVGLAVKKFADFDEAMSNVKAATQESVENMGLLRDAALDAGARTVFSATEAANAIEELGKAGLSTSDILSGGLDGALDLASAGQLGVAEAAGIAATAMKTFNLRGSDMSHVADLLAAGAGKAMGDVSDLSMALAQAGLVANSTGLTIEETTGALAAFASKGLLGSDAGTAFKSMLQRLTPVSAESKKEMDRLGISAFDAAGEFIGMEAFAGNLQSSLKDLTVEQRNAAMAQIFGTDAVRAANVLYAEGADGIAEWNRNVNDSGFAAKVAADRLDNLKGDVEQLGGAFDTYLIKSGSGANDVLRALTQGATGLVTAIGDLPEPVLAGGLALGGLIAAIGLAGGAALIAVPKVAQFKVALTTLGISGGTAARGIGLASGALAIAGVAFSLWAAKQAEATASTAAFQDSLDSATGAVTDYTRELVAKKLSEKNAFEDAAKYSITQKELTDAVLEGGKAMEIVKGKLDSASEGMVGNQARAVELAAKYGDASMGADELSGFIGDARQDLDDQAAAADGSAESTGGAADAYLAAADNASELQSNLSKLIDTINEANGVGQDAITTNAAYQGTLVDVAAEVAAYAAANGISVEGINEQTEAGSANQAMFAGLAKDAATAAEAQYEYDLTTMSAKDATEKYLATVKGGRKALYDQIFAITGNAAAAQALTDKIYAVPTQHLTDVIVKTSNAEDALRRVQAALSYINDKTVRVTIKTSGKNTLTGFASGGPSGDDIPANAVAGFVHGREFVSNARTTAVPENRRALEYMHAGGVIRGYAGGGFVQPQYVQSAPQYASANAGAPSQQSTIIQRVSETINVQVDGRTMASALRTFDRSLK